MLGCTHYPLLRAALAEVVAELWSHPVTLVDSAQAMADATAELLAQQGLLAPNRRRPLRRPSSPASSPTRHGSGGRRPLSGTAAIGVQLSSICRGRSGGGGGSEGTKGGRQLGVDDDADVHLVGGGHLEDHAQLGPGGEEALDIGTAALLVTRAPLDVGLLAGIALGSAMTSGVQGAAKALRRCASLLPSIERTS